MDQNLGKRLTQARLAKGVTVEDAAKATRMRPGLIRALEDGNLSQFPNAAYAKSFLVLYSKYLAVDVSDFSGAIDTATQMRVEDFQYLTSRASEERRLQRDATDTRYDFVVPKKTGGSWLPLIILVSIVAIGVIVFVVWNNLNRLSGATASNPPPPAAKEAVQPAETPIQPEIETGEFVGPPLPPLAPEPPTRVVEGGTPPKPGNPPLVGVVPQPPPVEPGPPTPPLPPAPEETTTQELEPGTIVLEPHKKAWIVIRNGPGGQTLYEDYLYPSAKAMHLPPGRYFIELRDGKAVEITKNGKVISYTAPGVLVD